MACATLLRHTLWAASRRSASVCTPHPLRSSLQGSLALARRGVSNAGSQKLTRILRGEFDHETQHYEQTNEVRDFLKYNEWKLTQEEGDVNLCLERKAGNKVVTIDWQLTSPFDRDIDADFEGMEEEATDFSITIRRQSSDVGMVFYCSTHAGEDHRYVIGNVGHFADAVEKDSMSAYNGPEFDDLDERLQEALDEYLAEVGINSDVCDFIDAMAFDKEQREYVQWLRHATSFFE